MMASRGLPQPRHVVLQYIEGCVNWRRTRDILCDLQPMTGFALETQRIDSAAHAQAVRFRGSPTVLFDGIDPFAGPRHPVGYACRRYPTPAGWAGSPTPDQLRTALGIPR